MIVGVFQQSPNRITDRVSMSIDAQVFRFYVMAGEVKILDPLRGHGQHEFVGVILVIDAVDDDIIDVQQ